MIRGIYHYVEEDIAERWVAEWAAVGITQFEDLLGKHAAFLAFLTARLEAV